MDLSDIIYIICLALGIFLPLLQRKEKEKATKKQQGKPTPHPVNEEYTSPQQDMYADNEEDEYYDEQPDEQPVVITSLDDIFRALREGKPLAPPKPQTVPAVKEEPIDVVPQKVASTPFGNLPQEGIRSTTNIIENEISDNGIYTDETETAVFNKETVDWRQAVVASEILNRKY